MKDMNCPRRVESSLGNSFPGPDTWRDDNCCSYCGSLNPDALMDRIEAGDVELGPTDKNYKVYVRNSGGEQFKQHYRKCPTDSGCASPDDCTHWVTREMSQAKFYFQHLADEQIVRFVDLSNQGKLKIGMPGHFYRLPFFMKTVK